MAKTSLGVWAYEEARPYSAPLTKSAAEEQPAEKHTEYVDKLANYIRYRITEDPRDQFPNSNYDHTAVSFEKPLPDFATRPDYVYDDGDVIVIGDAKANKSDLCDSHTVSQFCHYIEYLQEAEHVGKQKFVALMTPFNLGGIARAVITEQVLPQFKDGIGDIQVLYATELDGCSLPAPAGWSDIDFSECRVNEIQSKKYGVVKVTEKWVPLGTLRFDPSNSRLIGIEPPNLTQSECYARLLADGDCARQLDAVSRRSQMLSGSIKEPLWITSDGTVHDGNSRYAYATHIDESTNGHAPGYKMVKVFDFGDADPSMLQDIKQEKQSMTVLDHGAIQYASDMWRRYTLRKQSIKEITEDIYTGKFSFDVVERSIKTVEWLKTHGYNTNKAVKDMYYPVYRLLVVPWKRVNKVYAQHGITFESLIKTAAKATDARWRTMNGMDNIAKAVSDPIAPDWKIKALENFLYQADGWASLNEWNDSDKKLQEEQKRYTAKMAQRQLSSAVTSIRNTAAELENASMLLESVACGEYEDGADWKKSVYSRRELLELGEVITQLTRELKNMKSEFADVNMLYDQVSPKRSKGKKTAAQNA